MALNSIEEITEVILITLEVAKVEVPIQIIVAGVEEADFKIKEEVKEVAWIIEIDKTVEMKKVIAKNKVLWPKILINNSLNNNKK